VDRFDESNLINWREVAELPAAGSIISYELIGSNFESSIQSQRILFASLRSSTTPQPTHQSECLGHEKVLSGSKFPEETSKGVSKNKQRCHKQLSQVRQDLCLQKNEFDF